jgi:hypothetical protein
MLPKSDGNGWPSLREVEAASVGGLFYPTLATALLARWRIDFSGRLCRLHHHRKPGAAACRTFLLGRFRGWLFHDVFRARFGWPCFAPYEIGPRETGA